MPTQRIEMDITAVNFTDKLALFSQHWSPRIIARLNDTEFRLVKFQGEFVWHRHTGTDEAFIVIEGAMAVEFRDSRVDLRKGEMLVVPRDVEHRPSAENECAALVIESAGTVNTGDAGGDLTKKSLDWI
jgi:mannose-6-phosphate isomerase-like protein (cupin superfamily)